jgi:hypothetical protein
MADWPDVAKVLLGSWPTQVAAWGREGIAAYVAEAKDRGLTPDAAIYALRTWPNPDWPPSAGNLVAAALVDPSTPTFEEALDAIYGRGGILKARPEHKALITEDDELRAKRDALEAAHPLIASFALSQGLTRLAGLPLEDPEWGTKHRRDLEAAWTRHLESGHQRQVAALAAGGAPRRLDPAASLQIERQA